MRINPVYGNRREDIQGYTLADPKEPLIHRFRPLFFCVIIAMLAGLTYGH
jgi:hypothetical protein